MLLKCKKGLHLTNSEQQAIDYINDNVDTIADMTISEIAEKAFVSASTISRAIKKCGIGQLVDVRHQLAVREIAEKNFVANNILEGVYREFTKTIERIDTTAVLQFVEYLRSAKTIYILAQGCTMLAAQEFQTQLRWLGIIASVEWDPQVMQKLHMLVEEDDLVVVYSVANSNPELFVGVQNAKSKNAKVVTCCCKAGTPLEEYSDVVINVGYYSSNIQKNGFSSVSLMGLHAITRTIIEFLITQ